MKKALGRSGVLCACLWLCGALADFGPLRRAAAGPPAKGGVDAATKKLMGANGFFRHGRYDAAGKEYADFLKKYPSDKNASAARYGLAICRYRLSQHAEAAQLLDQALQAKSMKKRDEALAVLGHCRLSTKAYDKALAAFEALLKDHPTSAHAEFAEVCRLQALYMQDKKKETVAAARAFLKKRPASGRRAAVEYYLALSLAGQGEHKAAGEVLTGLLKKHPNCPYALDATLLLGQCLENQNDLDAAAAQYRKMIQLAPADTEG